MTRIQELEKLIKHHKAMYYQGRPEIPDHEYDKLEDELKKIDPENRILEFIGSKVQGQDKVKHDKKMLSLGKTYEIDELVKWMGEEEIVSTMKIDGVSCSLIYENGHLVLAKTRGDGTFGENITQKVMWMNTVPSALSDKTKSFEVRGELFCREEDFFHLSQEMQSLGLEKPSSQRNIVAGLISRKENVELCRYIEFMAFELISDDFDLKFETDKFKELARLGIETPDTVVHKNKKSIEKTIEESKQFMSEGDFQIDGIVFTYNKLSLHEELGETAHHPRYKMAFKFEGESKETIIKEILWSVSRNGILTPVGNVEPVELSGAVVSRVTLHNYGMVKQYELKKGDKIEIIRSGEVIPKFLSVVKPSSEPFVVPENCPTCESKVQKVDIRLYCSNDHCPDRVRESILNFIKKIGIDDLSSKRLEEMLKVGLVKEIPDLYKLTTEDFLTLDKVKDKLASKFYETIQASKNVDFITFLSALGLTGGAYNKCEKVVHNGFDTIEKIRNATVEDLSTIESFAQKSATEFLTSFKERERLIDDLVEIGFVFEEKEIKDTPLNGKKVCITGSLSEKRSVIEGWIRDAGGATVGSVSKKTDFLLTNDKDSGSSKAKKANELNIPIISEDDLKKMIQ
ncbi:MAG: DNA ligase (NAD(+)) LigA [Deltaproteobacteria bacterium]|nr:MAG: DNA ligase (NAD(+)) LigA [Deltaproteobacteria bacterium]